MNSSFSPFMALICPFTATIFSLKRQRARLGLMEI